MSHPTLYFASDHAGFALKKSLMAHATSKGYPLKDLGTSCVEAVDYPDYAKLVAEHLKQDPQSVGILICGTGVGMCIAANRYPWVRAAVCNDSLKITKLARAHNHANVLCLGGRLVGPRYAKKALDTFLHTPFEGGRHATRVDKLG
jgi:ribose 5-phosphate isomerase B